MVDFVKTPVLNSMHKLSSPATHRKIPVEELPSKERSVTAVMPLSKITSGLSRYEHLTSPENVRAHTGTDEVLVPVLTEF